MAPKKPWLQNHELAESETRRGWEFEAHVRDALQAAQLQCTMPDKSWRKDVADRKSYKNEIDLICRGRRLSVKSRRVSFTTPDDVPSANNPLFIEGTRKWDGQRPSPWAVVCISQITHAMIWLPGSTQPQWGRKATWDRVRGIPIECYTAPKELWQPFASLATALRTVDDGGWVLVCDAASTEYDLQVADGYVVEGAPKQLFVDLVTDLRKQGTVTAQRVRLHDGI